MDTLLEPFQYGFFRHAIEVATVAGALCGLVGVHVVLRGMSYIGHGLSHAIFGGAVASFVMKINFYVGAGLWGIVSALLINKVARRRTIGADARHWSGDDRQLRRWTGVDLAVRGIHP